MMLDTDLTGRALTLAQVALPSTPDLSRRLGDVVQYITATGMIAVISLLISLRDRVKSIETLLTHPKMGVVDRTEAHSTTIGEHERAIGEHETRLDNHDREFREIRRGDANYPPPPRGTPERR